jgi:2-succinyl-5-enolpyruvyl-6-hydroxy-3-cyclohexene-1-carboxylate synthase
LAPVSREPNPKLLNEIAERIRRIERGVIVCGPRDFQDGLAEAVLLLGRATGYPVLAEATSNVRFGHGADVIATYEALLQHDGFKKRSVPELVLRFGGGITSKRLQAWMDGAEDAVLFSDDGAHFDPSHSASAIVEGDPVRACAVLAQRSERTATGWTRSFHEADRQARAGLEAAFAASDALTEPRIARDVAAALPTGSCLFVSSSMPIRDLDAFASTGNEIRALANRGANGIDGLVSSSLGAGIGTGAHTVLLTGDLAFLHDLNGFLIAHRHRLSLTVVIVQNDGGGIFSFLPIAQYPERFEEFFGTPHGLAIEQAAKLFGAHYSTPRTPTQLRASLKAGFGGGLHWIEIKTERDENVSIHRQLYDRVLAGLEI